MTVLWLQLYHIVVVIQRFLKLVSQQVAFRPFMDIAGFVESQFYGFGEWGNRFLKHFQVRVRDAEMVVDVCFVGLEWFVLECGIEIFDRFFELFIAIVCQPSFVEKFGVSGFAIESIGQIINCFGVLPNINKDIAPLH